MYVASQQMECDREREKHRRDRGRIGGTLQNIGTRGIKKKQDYIVSQVLAINKP